MKSMALIVSRTCGFLSVPHRNRTGYPVASTNTKDFYNLVDVYLDAVFFPRCVEDYQTFQQEGWHYELNDPSEDITYKGVVFNEMKGVYSQHDSILGRASQQMLECFLFEEHLYFILRILPISLIRYLMGIIEEERERRHEEILSTRFKDFKEFADVIEVVKSKGVTVAVASRDDVEAANKECSDFFQVIKAF